MERYYRSFSSYLRERFGEKVYRVSLDAGFTCPNRDGTLGWDGCAYCSGESSWSASSWIASSRSVSSTRAGSGSGSSPSLGSAGAAEQASWKGPPAAAVPLREQVEKGKARARRRYGALKFIAYFQAYTSTYAPVERLKEIYDSVIEGDEEFVALAVGTRPDCVDDEKLGLLASYIARGLEVWVEYGLQTARDETLELIGRGHSAEDFARAVRATRKLGIKVSAHVIIGLPGEGRDDVIRTAGLLSDLKVDGVKIHNLNILKHTRMADWYARGHVRPLELPEYAALVVDFLERLPSELVIERLVTDSSPRLLVEPRWSLKKQEVLEAIHGEFDRRGSWQGKFFASRGP